MDWPGELVAVTDATLELFERLAESDWPREVAHTGWTARVTIEHIAGVFIDYAGQIAGRSARHYAAFSFDLARASTQADLLEVVQLTGRLLADAVAAAEPNTLAWQPQGFFDPAGFAAVACTEGLVHGLDVAEGLGIEWHPPDELADPLIRALFPEASGLPGTAAERLLWATGRRPLGAAARRTSWDYRHATR